MQSGLNLWTWKGGKGGANIELAAEPSYQRHTDTSRNFQWVRLTFFLPECDTSTSRSGFPLSSNRARLGHLTSLRLMSRCARGSFNLIYIKLIRDERQRGSAMTLHLQQQQRCVSFTWLNEQQHWKKKRNVGIMNEEKNAALLANFVFYMSERLFRSAIQTSCSFSLSFLFSIFNNTPFACYCQTKRKERKKEQSWRFSLTFPFSLFYWTGNESQLGHFAGQRPQTGHQ